MNNEESREERLKRFSKIWAMSRAEEGKTQEYMAKSLGVSKKTIQNWENGVTAPDLFMGSEWFRALGINPVPYYLAFIYPEMFDNLTPENDDEEIENVLVALVKQSTNMEKRELLYLMAGNHGSSWYSLLQMFTAHCHTSMKSRVNIARSILDSYEMEYETGALVCTDNVMPDLSILSNAVEAGKQSVINGLDGYTNMDSDINPSE